MRSTSAFKRDSVISSQPFDHSSVRHGRLNVFFGGKEGSVCLENEHSNSITDCKRLFPFLAKRLEEDCAHLSSVHEMEEHPCLRTIVSTGKSMIPLILKEVESEPRSWWFSALREISGKNAVKSQNRGFVRRMAEDWFEWAESEGIRW